jgi:hypothetical protein
LSYLFYTLTWTALLGAAGWRALSRGDVARLITWKRDRPRRGATVGLVFGLMIFGLDFLGFVLFEPALSSNMGRWGTGGVMGLGWIIAWGSVWVLVMGSASGPCHTSAANGLILLAYIVLGLVLTVMALSALRSMAAHIVPQEAPPAELTSAMQLTWPQNGYCIAPDDNAQPETEVLDAHSS